ncbi:MAG TPA: TolC family protein [Pyrinomonadaceae bacterium]|nr:TolC family protein [Pyrinomonadaceae bacterium]
MRIRLNSLLLSVMFVSSLASIGGLTISAQGQEIAKYPPATAAAKSVAAAQPKPEPANAILARPDLARIGVQTAQPIPLSVDDAIRKALENNNSIEITRDDVRYQETQIRSILGTYDPVFTISPTINHNSITGNAATNDFTANANMLQFVKPGGGNYQVFFNNTRTENAFSQAQVSSGSIGSGGSGAIYSSTSGVRFTQPLFRNRRIDNTRRNLKIARRRLEQSDADFRRQTIDTIAQVQRTYWDLVFALRDQQNRVANLDLTRESMRQIEARIAAGAAAPLARAEVATELATREADLLLATQQVSITENSLKQLILKDPASPEWLLSYLPTDKPIVNLDPVNLDSAMKDAMDNRFELRRLKLAKDINSIDIAFFKNQTRPQIDLNTTFSLDGLSRGGASTADIIVPQFSGNEELLRQKLNTLLTTGQQIPATNIVIPGAPSFLAGGFGRSLANTFRTDAPNYSVGVTISFPLKNRRAEADLEGARILQTQLDSQTRQQEQQVVLEVRNAAQAVETARLRVQAATRARENAEIQLEGERKLFEAGKSTTFLLFQRENALTNARNAEIRAETDYSKAITDLQRATSTTFLMNNIDVESPTGSK